MGVDEEYTHTHTHRERERERERQAAERCELDQFRIDVVDNSCRRCERERERQRDRETERDEEAHNSVSLRCYETAVLCNKALGPYI